MTPDQWMAFFVIVFLQFFTLFALIWIGLSLRRLIESK